MSLDGQIDEAAPVDTVQLLHQVETVTAAEKLRWVAEMDARQAWRAEGTRSTTDMLAPAQLREHVDAWTPPSVANPLEWAVTEWTRLLV